MTCQVKLYKLFISYSDRHLRNVYQKDYIKVHDKPASVQQIQSLVNWKTQPQTVFTFMHLVCAGFRKRIDSICGSPKKAFYHYFPILHREERGSPWVTARTVNRHALLLKKLSVLYSDVGSNCSCPLSLVLLDNLILSSHDRTQMHSQLQQQMT